MDNGVRIAIRIAFHACIFPVDQDSFVKIDETPDIATLTKIKLGHMLTIFIERLEMERYCNLVFQGGGVKGIAYAGVLQEMPKNIKIKGVGGTSAGAIAAGLLAIGKDPKELENILDRQTFSSFIDPMENARLVRIKKIFDEFRLLQAAASNSGSKKIGLIKLLKFAVKHRSQIQDDLGYFAKERGFHKTEKIRAWLDRQFGTRTFEDIVTDDLKIVAADTRSKSYRIFSRHGHQNHRNSANTLIAEAIHQSISIPFFFHPFISGNVAIVDGGILSNFPSFLFLQSPYPTIGFKLQDVDTRDKGDFLSYCLSIFGTMAEAHDNYRGTPAGFECINIVAPIPSTKFNLDESEQDLLLLQGKNAGKSVNWIKNSSERPDGVGGDTKPQTALKQTLLEASRLFNISSDKNMWPDELNQVTNYRVWIEKDWTAKYITENIISIRGKNAIFVNRLKLTLVSIDKAISLVDVDFMHSEVIDGIEVPLVKIPCTNLETQKAYLTFFWPPVCENQAERKFVMRYTIPEEFASTLGNPETPGAVGDISYFTAQRAVMHRFHLNCSIYVHSSLIKSLQVPGEIGGQPVRIKDSSIERDGTYSEFSASGIVRDVMGKEKINIVLVPRDIPQASKK